MFHLYFKSLFIISVMFVLSSGTSWAEDFDDNNQGMFNRGGGSFENQNEAELENQNEINNQEEVNNYRNTSVISESKNAVSTEAVLDPNSAVKSLAAPICKMESYVKPIQGAKRFEVVYDGGAVLDKETGLIWQRDLQGNTTDLYDAVNKCYSLKIAGRAGWRLSRPEELLSLGDANVNVPKNDYGYQKLKLSEGHPFLNLPSGYTEFWTSAVEHAYVDPKLLKIIRVWHHDVNMFKLNSFYQWRYVTDQQNYWCVRKF